MQPAASSLSRHRTRPCTFCHRDFASILFRPRGKLDREALCPRHLTKTALPELPRCIFARFAVFARPPCLAFDFCRLCCFASLLDLAGTLLARAPLSHFLASGLCRICWNLLLRVPPLTSFLRPALPPLNPVLICICRLCLSLSLSLLPPLNPVFPRSCRLCWLCFWTFAAFEVSFAAFAETLAQLPCRLWSLLCRSCFVVLPLCLFRSSFHLFGHLLRASAWGRPQAILVCWDLWLPLRAVKLPLGRQFCLLADVDWPCFEVWVCFVTWPCLKNLTFPPLFASAIAVKSHFTTKPPFLRAAHDPKSRTNLKISVKFKIKNLGVQILFKIAIKNLHFWIFARAWRKFQKNAWLQSIKMTWPKPNRHSHTVTKHAMSPNPKNDHFWRFWQVFGLFFGVFCCNFKRHAGKQNWPKSPKSHPF